MRRATPKNRLVASLVLLIACCAIAPSAAATTASISPEGHLLIEGEPFFPVGIYHVSWIGNRQGGKAVPDLHLAADAGFNLFFPTIDARPDTQELLDAAEARGLYMIGEIPWPENGPAGFVNKWKHEPAMIGWLLVDDFNAPYNGPAYNHPPAQVAARKAELEALVPEHISYSSGGSYPGYRIQEFIGTMDLMGFQSYPLGAQNHPDEYALEENVDSFDWVRDELEGSGQVAIANPQAYKWGGSRFPTAREARNFLYGSLIRGVKGVIWYAMWEGSDKYMPKLAPALWADMPLMNAETKTMVPFYLHGERTDLVTGDERVHASYWELDGRVLVVVLGTKRTGSTPVALDLPANVADVAHVPFGSRPEAGMTVTGGQLTGAIGPEEVHVYLIDTDLPGNQAPTASFDVTPGAVSFGSPATLDATASFDPDGSVVAWEWAFGDGESASGSVVQHTWKTPGTYDVILTVRDDDGTPRTTIVPVDVTVTSLCPPAPLPGCRTASSSFVLRDAGVAAKRTFTFTWKRGAATLPELGDPTDDTEVALCLYDANGLALATGSRAGDAWDAVGATGYRLRDPSGGAGGIISARLKPGAGIAASLTVKGKGIRLPDAPLPLVPPVTAQLTTSDGGVCWQGVYAAGGTTRSTATSFSGRN